MATKQISETAAAGAQQGLDQTSALRGAALDNDGSRARETDRPAARDQTVTRPHGEKLATCSPIPREPLGDAEVVEKGPENFARQAPPDPANPRLGRPRKLDAKTKGVIVGMLVLGVSRRKVADYVGCHHTTIVNEAKRDPQFAHEMQKAEIQSRTLPLTEIYHAAKSNWRAAAWLVRRSERAARRKTHAKRSA